MVRPLVPSSIGPALLSYQSAEDSLGSQCAPSHTLTGSTANGNTQAEAAAYLPGLYTLGWTVVAAEETISQVDGAPYQAGASGNWFVDRATTVLPFCHYYNAIGIYSMRSYSLAPRETMSRSR